MCLCVLLRASGTWQPQAGYRGRENIGLRSGDVPCSIRNTHTCTCKHTLAYCIYLCTPMMSSATSRGLYCLRPPGQGLQMAGCLLLRPLLRCPHCACVCLCALACIHLWMCVNANTGRERERDVHLRNCAHFLSICLQGGPCLCVDGVRASQRQHTARQKCDIPSKASSEPFPLQRRV